MRNEIKQIESLHFWRTATKSMTMTDREHFWRLSMWTQEPTYWSTGDGVPLYIVHGVNGCAVEWSKNLSPAVTDTRRDSTMGKSPPRFCFPHLLHAKPRPVQSKFSSRGWFAPTFKLPGSGREATNQNSSALAGMVGHLINNQMNRSHRNWFGVVLLPGGLLGVGWNCVPFC